MTSFLNCLNEELAYLLSLESDLIKDPLTPKRYAVALKHKYKKDYYWNITTKDGKRSPDYLGDAGSEKVREAARSSYKKVLMQTVRQNIKVLEEASKKYRSLSKTAIISRLSPCLRDLRFDTGFNSMMKELEEWAAADYKRNPKPFNKAVIRAKDGTRVRSRAECIIYNLLFDAGIPFRYDPVMQFKRKNEYGGMEEYSESPDFLIKCPDGEYIIIEHAGLLTSAQYATDLAHKLQIYQLNGFFIGRSLFVTSDDIEGGIDSQEISNFINYIKLRFPYL